jgi:hypothetical protein
MEGSTDDMLWSDGENVWNVSDKCEEDEGTDCEMDTMKNEGGDS